MNQNFDKCMEMLLAHVGRCPDAIKAATGEGFHYHLQGAVLKYLWRFEHKGNALQDLRKARWYLDRLIDEFDPTTD